MFCHLYFSGTPHVVLALGAVFSVLEVVPPVLSMLPIDLMQAWAAVEYGTWYARSADFLHSGHLNQLRWLRIVGDSIFAVGALVLGWFVLGLVHPAFL